MAILIPDLVEYLNPISFNLSSITDVSVVWYLLYIWAINLLNTPLLNASTKGILATSSGIFDPFSKKYFAGVTFSIFSDELSLIYWKESGNISLKINLPGVVTKYLSA